jgi:Leucine-rich repeat (LRR) protein
MLKRIIVYGVLLLWLCIAPVWFARDRAYQEAVAYVEQQIVRGSQSFEFYNPNLTKIPPQLDATQQVQVLKIFGNSLEQLPTDLVRWKEMRSLELKNLPLTQLSPEIGNLTNLISLDLSGSSLRSLPPEIGNLTSLMYLYLSDTLLTTLPAEIGNLTRLRQLNLNSSQITSLPPEIGNLKLEYLGLENTLVTTLPPEIGKSLHLESLRLRGSSLTTLPSEIGNVPYIQSLDLSDTQITSLPAEIGNLNILHYLDLSGLQITSLPPEIGNLTNLVYIDLSDSQIISLPPEIGNLSGLRELYLSGSQIISLPPEIGNLTNLSVLDLRRLQITSLPPEIGNLSNLEYVSLYRTSVETLPAEIGGLDRLLHLDLSNTQITSLPPEIGNLSGLQELYLSGSQITSLPPEMGKLKALAMLYLHNTAVATLPPEIEALPYLTVFHYGDTRYNDTTHQAMAIVYGGGFIAFILIFGISFAIYKSLPRRPHAVITPNKNKDSRRLTIYHVRWIVTLIACLVSFIPFVIYLGDYHYKTDIGNRHFIFVMLGMYLVAYGLTLATTVKTAQRLMQEGDIYDENNINHFKLWKNVFRKSIESHIWLVVPRFGIALGCAQIFHAYFDIKCSSLSQLRLLLTPYCRAGGGSEIFVYMPALLFVLAVLIVFACVECGLISTMASVGITLRGMVLRRGLVLLALVTFIGAYSLYPVRGEFALKLLTQPRETWFSGYNYNTFLYLTYSKNEPLLGDITAGLHEMAMSWVDSGILLSTNLLSDTQKHLHKECNLYECYPSPSLLLGVISLLGLLLATVWYGRKLRRG